MKRTIIIGVVQAIAMALALFWLFLTMIGHMMEPSGGGIGVVLQACAIAVVLVSAAAFGLLYLGRMNVTWLVASIALTFAASIAPEMIYLGNRQAYLVEKQAEERALEAKVVAELESRKRDVETQIAAKRSYTPEESLNFLFFMTG